MRGVDKMTIVIQEIMQDKIYLDMSGNLQTVEPTEELEMGGETVDLTQAVRMKQARPDAPEFAAESARPLALAGRSDRWPARAGARPGQGCGRPRAGHRAMPAPEGVPCLFDSECCAPRRP